MRPVCATTSWAAAPVGRSSSGSVPEAQCIPADRPLRLGLAVRVADPDLTAPASAPEPTGPPFRRPVSLRTKEGARIQKRGVRAALAAHHHASPVSGSDIFPRRPAFVSVHSPTSPLSGRPDRENRSTVRALQPNCSRSVLLLWKAGRATPRGPGRRGQPSLESDRRASAARAASLRRTGTPREIADPAPGL